MTPGAQRIAIVEACGKLDRFVLMKRGLYYRPNGHGYTNCISEAWIMTEAEADEHVYPHDAPVTKHRAPSPDYLNDLNAMHEAEKILNEPQRLWFMRYLIPDDSFDIGNRITNGMVWNVAHATANKRAEAFLMTLGKWVD